MILQKIVKYWFCFTIFGVFLTYGAQDNSQYIPIEVDVSERGMKSSYEHSLNNIPLDILQNIMGYLSSPKELMRLSQSSKYMCLHGESESLWRTIYEKEKIQLLPFLDLKQEIINIPFNSYKSALGIICILQRSFLNLEIMNCSLLKILIGKSLQDSAYRDLLLARLHVLADDEDFYKYQAFKILNIYAADRLLPAIYAGQGFFAKKSNHERFHMLELACEKNIPGAFKYKLSAIIRGDLDERSPQEIFKILYNMALNRQVDDKIVCKSLWEGKGFGQENRSLENRFKDLENLAYKNNSLNASSIIIRALYHGYFYSNYLSEEERFLRLKNYIEENRHPLAIYYMVPCLVEGKLGQGNRLESERFNDLLSLLPLGNSTVNFANSPVADALINGTLGQKEVPLAKRLKILEKLAFEEQERDKKGNEKHLGELGTRLVNAIVKWQELDHQGNWACERFKYLEDLADRGLLTAQESVVRIIIRQQEPGSFFYLPLNLDQEELFKLLEFYCKLGYEGPQLAMVEALYNGNLGQGERPVDDRCKLLKLYADLGASCAQEYLSKVIENGGFPNHHEFGDFLHLSSSLLWSLKLEKAYQADRKAQNWVYEAIYEGTHGQNQEDPSLRLEFLTNRAMLGWYALCLMSELPKDRRPLQGKVYLEKKSDKLSYILIAPNGEIINDTLDIRINTDLTSDILYNYRTTILTETSKKNHTLSGDPAAIGWVVKALISNNFGKKYLSDGELLNSLRFWALKGNEEAQKQIVNILDHGFFGQHSLSALSRFQSLQDLIYQGNSYALEKVCRFLSIGMPVEMEKEWPKDRRIKALEELSAQGYNDAQSILVCTLLGRSYNSFYYQTALTPNDLGRTPQERFDRLTIYGDSNNSCARVRMLDFLDGNGFVSQEMRELDGSYQRSLSFILKWVSQGDFSLIDRLIKVLKIQGEKKEKPTAIGEMKYLKNLFLLYKTFVRPTLEDINIIKNLTLNDCGYSTPQYFVDPNIKSNEVNLWRF